MRLTNDLRTALKGDQFRLYFQPIVHLASGKIHKAEALIRWQHPQRGLVSPIEFIPLAESSGLILDIGEWVFKESARGCSAGATSTMCASRSASTSRRSNSSARARAMRAGSNTWRRSAWKASRWWSRSPKACCSTPAAA
ncbi:EAL domain-containing protein [Massilia sp. H-1]|nr:EAL domain-containing protein [Massilia sp. H-1]